MYWLLFLICADYARIYTDNVLLFSDMRFCGVPLNITQIQNHVKLIILWEKWNSIAQFPVSIFVIAGGKQVAGYWSCPIQSSWNLPAIQPWL